MRREIIFWEEPQIVARSTNRIVREKQIREIKPKDNSRKIASLQKQIEKMQSSWLWNAPYTHRRQRFLDWYTIKIKRLQKQIEELWWTWWVDIEAQKLEQKIKWQLLKKIPWYFPTPKDVVKRMVELAEIEDWDYIMEPSAWTGAIVDWILETWKDVKIYPNELNYSNYEILLEKYKWNDNIICMNYDFTTYDSAWKFDKIIMNPPFEDKQDMQHIKRAFSLLKDWWILVAICSAWFSFRSDYRDLKALFDEFWEYEEKLDSWTFRLSWTMVNSVLLVFKK